jgi:hypothetical protein
VTRSTLVAVLDPGIAPMDMWATMATLIRAPEQYRFTVGPGAIHAEIGQGLCALLDLSHGVDGALVPAEGCDDWCESSCDAKHDVQPAHYLLADFDTAYSYTAPCGCHAGGLHPQLVSQLGAWLDSQGIRWAWYDESGDGWAHGPDWGTLAGSACPEHRRIPAPAVVSP